MKKEFQMAKGVKDWYGVEAILRNKIKHTLKEIFEKYGYNPLETPIMENIETLSYKGGGEIQKEVFQLKDQGGRNLALRFDQTVPLGRFFSTQKDLKIPFKRYVIGEVFRDGPTQPEQGRYRSFTQCDVDVLGIKEMSAELELFSLAKDVFENLGLGQVEVKINNRKLLDGILTYANIPDTLKTKTIITLDKLDKIGLSGVTEELYCLNNEDSSMNNISKDNIDNLIELIKPLNNNTETYKKLKKVLVENEGLNEIKEIIDYSNKLQLDFIKFDPALARGLDYYTGTTIEVYLKDKSIIKSAIVAGGRYDNMIGSFKGVEEEIPAVGISFGLERLTTIISNTEKELQKNITDLYIIPIGNTKDYCMNISQKLRKLGLNVDMQHMTNQKLKKSISYADNVGIPYIGLVGDMEASNSTITLKNLQTGIQEELKPDEVYKKIRG